MAPSRAIGDTPGTMSTNLLSLEARLAPLRQRVDPALVDRFAAFLQDAGDDELFRVSPYGFAGRAGVDRTAALDLFLHATQAGVLEFTWGVVCPTCAAFLTTQAALRSLETGKDCKL